jgi:hypothetical protein
MQTLVCAFALVWLAASAAPLRAEMQVRDPRMPQAPPAPRPSNQDPRDRRPAPQVGTASVKGRVVDGVTGRAIARARVRLQGPVRRPAVLTDEGGSFAFSELPQGMYFLMTEKSTYSATRYPESGRSLRSRAQSFPLTDGEAREDVTVTMHRGGAIAGRVLDAYGDPLEGAMVNVLWAPKGGRPMMRGGGQSNDLGEFRIARLQPGRYLVRVRPSNNFQPDPMLSEQPLPQPLSTYYPGTLAPDQAHVIVVNRGETVSGIDVALAEGVPSVVSGIVLPMDGQLGAGQAIAGGSISARPAGPNEVGGMQTGTGIRPDGTFRLLLPPGDYVLEAHVAQSRATTQQSRPQNELLGVARVSVGTSAVENVSIFLGGGAVATGRVVFEGTTPAPPSPGEIRVPLSSQDGGGCRPPMATIGTDWSFKVEGLSGTCGLQPGAAFGRWHVKAVMFREKNLMEEQVSFEPGQQYSNVQIVVSDRPSQAVVRVTDEAGQPTREFVAILFPTNKERWSQFPRYARTISPAPPPPFANPRVLAGSGMTQINGMAVPRGSVEAGDSVFGLAAGEYYAIALDDIDQEDMMDVELLEHLTSSAVRFTLSHGAPVEIPLRRLKLADVVR